MCEQGTLRFDGGVQPAPRGRKRDEERVTLGVDFLAPVPFKRGTQQCAMLVKEAAEALANLVE